MSFGEQDGAVKACVAVVSFSRAWVAHEGMKEPPSPFPLPLFFLLFSRSMPSCTIHTLGKETTATQASAVVRAPASHQCGPGLILVGSHMWVEFVVGSDRCSEDFSLGTTLVFFPQQKTTFLNSNLI